MSEKAEVWQGTLALMVLKTLETLGPLHGYGIARRIEQTSGDLLSVNYGTLYPALLRLEQEGYVVSEWGVSEKQPKGTVLQPDAGGPQKSAAGGSRMGSRRGHRRPLPRSPAGGPMRPVRAWLVRLWNLFSRGKWERRMAEELEAHLQMDIDDGIGRGLAPAEARRQALVRLGGLEATKENLRDRHVHSWLETTIRDAAFALRTMRRTPGLTVTIVLTLALGIGATTAIFSIVDRILLRPLPFSEPERLLYITAKLSRAESFNPFAYTQDYPAWREHHRDQHAGNEK